MARALPLYSRKSSGGGRRTVTVEFLLVPSTGVSRLEEMSGRSIEETDLQCLRDVAEGVRLAARITDTPCKDMHTDSFIRASVLLITLEALTIFA